MAISNHCIQCTKRVRNRDKGNYCNNCCLWVHLRCIALNACDYRLLSNNDYPWFCSKCLASMFSFNVLDDDFAFLACIFNYNYCSKSNAEIVRNSDQLNFNNKLNISNNYIDPDKFFIIMI